MRGQKKPRSPSPWSRYHVGVQVATLCDPLFIATKVRRRQSVHRDGDALDERRRRRQPAGRQYPCVAGHHQHVARNRAVSRNATPSEVSRPDTGCPPPSHERHPPPDYGIPASLDYDLRLRDARHPRRPGARRRAPARWCRRSSRPAPTRRTRSARPGRGYEYSRTANPTRDALQECLAALEGGRAALAFASGLAAEDTLLRTVCQPGDHVVIPDDAYGGTYRLFAKVAQRWGLDLDRGDDLRRRRGARPRSDPAARRSSGWRRRPTRCSASPTSPRWPRSRTTHGALLVVDNTFASPYLQQPLAPRRGRGGALDHQVRRRALRRGRRRAGRRRRRARRASCAYHQNAMGAINGPFDAWLTLRGIKTLGVRMDRHCDNAERIVEFLTAAPGRGARCSTRACRTHPGHEIAAKQMRRFGGMVCFRAAGGEEHGRATSATGPSCSCSPSRSAAWSR